MSAHSGLRHGTNRAYCAHGCRCAACRAEHARIARVYGSNVRTGKRAEQKRAWDDAHGNGKRAAA